MTDQPRLWTPSVEAVELQAHFGGHEGWQLRINWRREGDVWGSEPAEFYDALAVAELLDVAAVSLELLLRPAGG